MGWSTFILLGWFDGPMFDDQDILGMVFIILFRCGFTDCLIFFYLLGSRAEKDGG